MDLSHIPMIKLWCKAKTDYVSDPDKDAVSVWVHGFAFVIDSDTYIINPDTEKTYKVRIETLCLCANERDGEGNLIYENDVFDIDDKSYLVEFDWNTNHAFILKERFSPEYILAKDFDFEHRKKSYNLYD